MVEYWNDAEELRNQSPSKPIIPFFQYPIVPIMGGAK